MAPIGGDKVFIYHFDKEVFKEVYSEMMDFFLEFLYYFQPMSKDGNFIYEIKAWVTCYKVHLHAWNAAFFSCLICDCMRDLKVDECSSEKLRLDYA